MIAHEASGHPKAIRCCQAALRQNQSSRRMFQSKGCSGLHCLMINCSIFLLGCIARSLLFRFGRPSFFKTVGAPCCAASEFSFVVLNSYAVARLPMKKEVASQGRCVFAVSESPCSTLCSHKCTILMEFQRHTCYSSAVETCTCVLQASLL